MGSATRLISFDEGSKKFRVEAEGIAVLKKVPGPIAVVAVAGRARQGKSFLLNQLLGRLKGGNMKDGFQVSASTKPCTKGGWGACLPPRLPCACSLAGWKDVA